MIRENYENNLTNGSYEKFWSNGQLQSKGNLVNDKADGYAEYFTKDGKLADTILWKNGDEIESQETEYHQQYLDEIVCDAYPELEKCGN